MTENKVIKNKAGVSKELKLNNGWSIQKVDWGYTLFGKSIFIHGSVLRFGTMNKINAWLNVFQDGVYIASLWIDNAIEIESIKEFIKVV